MEKGTDSVQNQWQPGVAPVCVILISLNEGHYMDEVLRNISGWAQEVFLVDSYSKDDTVDIALRYGVHVVQRRFSGFGDQWNFALRELPITAPWTMKLDPDERLTTELKQEIVEKLSNADVESFTTPIRLFFMKKPLPIRLRLLRLWRSGKACMSDVLANEHLQVDGAQGDLLNDIEHHDSPDLDHWLNKQNQVTTYEAVSMYNKLQLADKPRLFGSPFQRRMWMKKHFYQVPFRYTLLFFYNWLWQGSWRSGWAGYAWSRLRSDYMRLIEYKLREITMTKRVPVKRFYGPGLPDPRVEQFN